MRRSIAGLVVAALLTGGANGVQAQLISAEAVAMAGMTEPLANERERLLGAVERVEVAAALAARGVDPEQARQRLMALTDAEAAELAEQMDAAPAGAYWLSPFFVASLVVALLYVVSRLDLIDRLWEAWFLKR